jgi:hypothetical protein
VAVFISLPLVSAEAGEASFLYAPDQLRALPFLGKKTFNGGGGGNIKKREKKEVAPKSGPIFCLGGLRLAGL